MGLMHILESQQFDRGLISQLFSTADSFREHSALRPLENKILATLFYEPSTRTRLSFESAMLRLGGQVITTENAKDFSSAVKGESLEDTARIISAYTDCIVIRHSEEGAAKRASAVATVPVINAGDGKGQHPTQALLDLYTIQRESGHIDGIKIAMVGDLACGRTVHSLSYLLGKFKDVQITYVSPPNLGIKQEIKDYLLRHNVKFSEETELRNVLPDAGIIYMTRLQKERMSPEDYQNAKGKYVLDMQNLGLIQPRARILHPLPHVEEINFPVEVEQTDRRIAYFRQAQNGLHVRMALLYLLMGPDRSHL